MQLWIEYIKSMKFWIFLFIFFLSSTRVSANDQAFPQKLESDLSAGTSAIYQLDFKSAERHFQRAIQMEPGHPTAYFFSLMALWYRLTYDSLLNRNSDLEKLLENQADATVIIAKRFSKNEKTESVGHLYWGGALGAKGWYYVARSQWVKAYFSGRKGYQLIQKVVEADPELYDAYLGLGMYEYYAATLGTALKVLSSFFIRGDKERAFQYLHLAQFRSRYVRLESAYFLWNAALEEGRFAEAVEKIKVLNDSFPNSPLFNWCQIQTLFYQKRWEEVLTKSNEYLSLAYAAPQPENYSSPYQLLLSKVFYHCGLAALNLKRIELAKSYFDKTIDQTAEFTGWKVMAYLRRGELFDLEGKRLDALGKYRAVLGFPEVWDSHRLARERIKDSEKAKKFIRQEIFVTPLQLWKSNL